MAQPPWKCTARGHLTVFWQSVAWPTSPRTDVEQCRIAATSDYFVDLRAALELVMITAHVRAPINWAGANLHVSVGAGSAPLEGDRFTIITRWGKSTSWGTF